MRGTATLIHLGFGNQLLELLSSSGNAVRLRPWAEAIRAINAGDKRALQDIAPEIRTVGERLFDRISEYLKLLPRPLQSPKPAKIRRTRSTQRAHRKRPPT